jgi:hypothetical protein
VCVRAYTHTHTHTLSLTHSLTHILTHTQEAVKVEEAEGRAGLEASR